MVKVKKERGRGERERVGKIEREGGEGESLVREGGKEREREGEREKRESEERERKERERTNQIYLRTTDTVKALEGLGWITSSVHHLMLCYQTVHTMDLESRTVHIMKILPCLVQPTVSPSVTLRQV